MWRYSSLAPRREPQIPASLRFIAISAGLALIVGTTGGCMAPGSPRRSLRVAVDVSQSQDRTEREALCGLLDEVVARCLPAGSDLGLWAFDREPRKLFEGTIEEAEELHPVQDELILGRSGPRSGEGRHVPKGTFIGPMLERMLGEAPAGRSRQERVGVLLLMDGEDWDRERTYRTASELAKRSDIQAVWVAGVLTDGEHTFRSAVERSFAPFGDRLIVSGTYDLKQGLDRFEARLEGGK